MRTEKHRTLTQLPIKIIDGNEFSISITIGTPPQQFSIAFDTAGYEDADFWVTSVACDPLYPQCKGHRKYDHRKSITYNTSGNSFQTALGTSGLLTSDTVAFGKLQIKQQEFGEGWNFPSGLANWHSDGCYSFSPMEHLDTGVTPFYNMVKEGLLAEPVVGMYIVKGNTSLGGELLLGGRDSSRYQGNLTYLNIRDELSGWEVDMDVIKVPSLNKSYCVNGCGVVFSNQDPYIVGKYPDAFNLNKALGATLYKFDLYIDQFKFDCKIVSSLPKVEFVIAGKKFAIGPEQYVLQMTETNGNVICVSAFLDVRADPGYDWSIGTAFFEIAYVEYYLQHKQVGVALSVY